MKFNEDDCCVVVEYGHCYLGKVSNAPADGYKVEYNDDFWWFNTEQDFKHPFEYPNRDAKIYTIEEFLEQFDLPNLKNDDKVQFFSQDEDAGTLCEIYSDGSGVRSIDSDKIDLRLFGYKVKLSSEWAVVPVDGTLVTKKGESIDGIDYEEYIGAKAKWVDSNGNVEYEGTIETSGMFSENLVIRSYDGDRNWIIQNGKSRCGNWKVELIKDKPSAVVALKCAEAAERTAAVKQNGTNYTAWSYPKIVPCFNPSQEQMDTTFKQIKQKEDKEMSNVRIVTVELIDNTAGIQEAADRVVAVFRDYATMDDNETTVREILMTKDVASDLLAHNEMRATLVNQDILERTGNPVMLQPVKLRDLTWNIKS